MAILRRTERAMVRAMCGAKLMVKKRTEDLMYGDVGIEGDSGSDGKGEWSEMVRAFVEEGDGHVLRKALEFEVKGKRRREQPQETWKTQVERESKSVGLEEDALIRERWRVGV